MKGNMTEKLWIHPEKLRALQSALGRDHFSLWEQMQSSLESYQEQYREELDSSSGHNRTCAFLWPL